MKPYNRDPKMDFPASHYGQLDKKNPVITSFERDINSFMTLMRRVVSSNCEDNCSYAKGIKILMDLWESYNHRLPFKLFHEQVLRIADFLYGIKLYQPALWHGYSLHLHQYTPVNIIEIEDVDHFKTCFFPEGFDTDKDVFRMKVRAMLGCALCLFEQEKMSRVLSQQGISKLLRVLEFIRIMMQAFQQHEHLCWIIHDATYYIYVISRYLMTINCSPQALEYLLWACISAELSIPLMTMKNVPWIVTLYCVVCHCYYDNNAAMEAEKFARRALGKIHELSHLEEKNGSATRETQIAFKEASVKLAVMIFKRAVFETRKKGKIFFKFKTKTSLKDIPNTAWPRTPTERILVTLFDSNAARFLAILEALWDSSTRPLQTKMPEELDMQEVVLELLSAGMSILSGGVKESDQDHSLIELTSTSTQLDLAIAGETKVSVLSAVRFIKAFFQFKQPEAFDELNREMLQVLSGLNGHPYRKAEMELTLLEKFSSLPSKEKPTKEDHNDRLCFLKSDECVDLLHHLHNFACESTQEMAPDTDLVIDIVLYLWKKLKLVLHRDHFKNVDLAQQPEKLSSYNSLVWSLSMLCEVAFACHLADFDCILVVEMVYCLALQLEKAVDQSLCTQSAATPDAEAINSGKTALSFFEMSSTELLHIVCEVVNRGIEALIKGVGISVPQDCTPIVDIAFMQKFDPNALAHTLAHVKRKDQHKTLMNEFNNSDTEEVNDDPVKGITRVFLLAIDFHLELDIIHHRASLKLLQLNAVSESYVLDWIKKNKASRALCLMQKALLLHKTPELNDPSDVHNLLEEACQLIEKAELEERKLYVYTLPKTQTRNKEKAQMEEKESPPPPPVLIGRTNVSLTFVPALYHLEERVFWYQLCGRVAEGINQKVRLGDCNLAGTGHLVPAKEGECLLEVRGLEPNQKYVFAVAAYDSHGKLLGNTIGMTSFPLLASMPIPLLSVWAHLAQVSYQTEQHDITKRACNELWNHYTFSDSSSSGTHDRFASTGLYLQTLPASSPLLCLQFLASVFTETEINIRNESLFCDIVSANGLFIWEQEARLAQCERMLVAMDLSMWSDDGKAAVQAAISCYSLLAPILFNQVPCAAVVQVLTKCFILLEENAAILKHKWAGHTSVTLMHMIACLTYYMSKTLRVLKDLHMAAVMMDRGRNLLQDIYDTQNLSKAAHTAALKISLHLKAIHGKHKKLLTMEATQRSTSDSPYSLPGCTDAASLYAQICSIPLKEAFRSVIKLRRRTYFVEFAALLLKRAMEEAKPDLVLKWGQSIFEFLSRRDKSMKASAVKSSEGSDETLRRNTPSVTKNVSNQLETRKKLKQKIPASMLLRVRTNRERLAVENMLTSLSSVVQRQRRLLQLRSMLCEELVWRAQLNNTIAQAHLTMFFRGLEQQHGGALEYSYSTLNPLSFSLAFTGVLIQMTDISPYQQEEEVIYGQMDTNKIKEFSAARVEYYVNENSSEEEESFEDEESCDEEREDGEKDLEDFEEPDEFALQEEESFESDEQFRTYKYTAALQWDSLNSVALHLRRAMVLAHRGSNWTLLLSICQTMWEQWCRVATTALIASQEKPALLLSTSQLNCIFDPLLVLASDLIMDMLDKQGLWRIYDDVTEDELQCSLNFSAQLDGCTQVDMRWVRTLVLRSLEQLYFAGKWESLAHFALLFNSYTRERYATVVAPLLIVAQRKLLERINSVAGPAVPQPHHVKTQTLTNKEVTYKTYAFLQLFSDWVPPFNQEPLTPIKSMTRNTPDEFQLQDEQMQHSLTLVCVPLNVDDTLGHFRQSLESKPLSLQSLYHSRSLLKLLLAYTQNYFVEDISNFQISRRSTFGCQGDNIPTALSTSNIQPFSQTKEEFKTEKALYSFPIGPGHFTTVTDAIHATINHLQADHFNSLRVLALHELGNMEFYNGNTEAARNFWNKGVDVALHRSGVLDKWDGVSYGTGSVAQTLKQAGIWGCLQAADLTAKIAQYVLISDISQRTKCSLLSAYLFKCVLCCSLAHPVSDLDYASFSILDEFFPGIDLFSEHHRSHVGTTVTSLNFVCQWLYVTGYHITLLPLLVLYIHIVGNMCRDVQRTIEGRILKMRALTELCLFSEAIKEAVRTARGTHVLLPNGHYITNEDFEPESSFHPSKPLLENTEAMDELMRSNIPPEICAMYGSTLCLRFELARIQLLLALGSTIQDSPRPEFTVKEKVEPSTSVNSNQEPETLDPEGSGRTDAPKLWSLFAEKENITPSGLKFLLLEEVSVMLQPIFERLTSEFDPETDNLELALECNLLMANLHLQQEHGALSSERAVSCLRLLQESASDVPLTSTISELNTTPDSSLPVSVYGDSPRAIEPDEIRIALWLRCHVALVHSLTAQIPDAAVQLPGMNIIKETTQVLQQGLNNCAVLGDVDNQALLIVECAELEAQRGKTDEGIAHLQRALSLLSGRTCMPPGSSLTLARATMLLSNLSDSQGDKFRNLSHKLLQKQLAVFGESVLLEDGKLLFSPPGPKNIYLPFIHLIDETSYILDQNTMET